MCSKRGQTSVCAGGWADECPVSPSLHRASPLLLQVACLGDFSPRWLTNILESFNQYAAFDFLIYHCDISVFFLHVPSHRPRCSLTLKWCGLTSTVWLSTVLFTTRSPQVTRSHLSLSLSFGIFASQRIENNLAFVSFYTTFEARASKCHSKPGWLVLKIYISFRWGIHTRWSFFSWRVFGVNMTHLSLFCSSTYGARTNLSFSLFTSSTWSLFEIFIVSFVRSWTSILYLVFRKYSQSLLCLDVVYPLYGAAQAYWEDYSKKFWRRKTVIR